jgi:uncharacterized membrane protein
MPPSWMLYQRHVLYSQTLVVALVLIDGRADAGADKAYDISTREQNDLPLGIMHSCADDKGKRILSEH